ncbi:p21-activated protein kinase-interacting protein 1-like [Octopus vulgaris]|uniref:P21-activated protein kinase-interacting protein 1-like n=1 Tax=Octopus vulgaris TaxID=6645 RepID=A0AA36B3R7_OCTVU|nr:p21-activated protein kinase-interacting protein 1-like [Octopus vulgaris]
MEGPIIEIIVGTYEELILAYRATAVGDNWQLEESFTDHSHSGCVRNVATSNNRNFLASGGTDENVWLFNLNSRKMIGSLVQHEGSLTHLQFHQGSHLFTCSEDGTMCLFQTVTWECLRVFRGHKAGINCLAVHPSGKLAFTVSKDKTMKAWNLIKGVRAYTTNLKRVADLVVWSLTGDTYCLVFNHKLEIYLTKTTGLIQIVEAPGRINSMLYMTNSLIVYGGEGSDIIFYDIEKEAEVYTLTTNSSRIRGLCHKVLPSGDNILANACSDGYVRVWKVIIDDNNIVTKLLAEHNSSFRLTCIAVYVKSSDSKSKESKPRKEVSTKETEVPSQDEETTKRKVISLEDKEVGKHKKTKKKKKTAIEVIQ